MKHTEKNPEVTELRIINENIRRYSSQAESSRETAAHFIERADEYEALAETWKQKRIEFLGSTCLDNVLPFPDRSSHE